MKEANSSETYFASRYERSRVCPVGKNGSTKRDGQSVDDAPPIFFSLALKAVRRDLRVDNIQLHTLDSDSRGFRRKEAEY